MNKFFYYYNPACSGSNMPTVFSNDPYVIEIKQMLLTELRQLVYYIQKLKDLNEDMTLYTDKVIEFIYVLIVNLDFKKESFYTIIEDLYNNKIMLKKKYISICNSKNISAELLQEPSENLSSKDIILNTVNKKETNVKIDGDSIPYNRKSLYEIMVCLVLNASSYLIELKNYGVNSVQEKDEVLKFLNSYNFSSLSDDEIVSAIDEFSICNYSIMKKLYSAISKKYGKVFKKEVSLNIKKGKAILVSGLKYTDLENILNAAKDKNINVYTHNGMINAFSYERFNSYTNLAGHYQYEGTNYAKDFANFPGPVYISDNLIPKIDIIKGQIFTSAKYPSFGISKIINDDFSPLIECALNSKGFDNNIYVENISVGFDEEEILSKTNTIIDKIKDNIIKRVFIIGQSDSFIKNNDYIIDFLKSISENDFVVSFNFDIQKENIWTVNSSYNFVVLYKIIEMLKEYIDKISIFFTDCNANIISHIFNLKQLGIKNILLGQCCPNVINPMIMNGLYDLFDVKQLSKPELDLKSM